MAQYGRPSVFLDSHSSRQSVAGNNNNANHNRLREKQREYEAYLKVLAQTEGLTQLFGGFGEKFDVLSGGSEAVATVVEHWQNVFRSTHLALASLNAQSQPASSDPEAPSVIPPTAMPDRLVRIPAEPEEKPAE